MNELTRKEIEIIYGYLYNIKPFKEYVSGYHQEGQEYDIREDADSIFIYYAGTSGYKVPVSRALERTL